MNSKKAHIDTRGTLKEAVTEGDPKGTNLVEASMCDTTHVHYISMVSEELKWVIKETECSNVDTGKVILTLIYESLVSMQFLNQYQSLI